MKRHLIYSFILISLLACSTKSEEKQEDAEVEKTDYSEKAKKLSRELIIVDTHVDVPYRLQNKWEDISQRTKSGHFDYVRAIEGGLNAPFMSIYIPARLQSSGGAKKFADVLIDNVYGYAEKWPEKFQIALSPEDIKRHFSQGLISLPMGMENGAPIENDLNNIKHFHDRGIRYITLTHSKWNHICDSSYDPDKHWNGLSPFGKKMITEMNRIGMMIDVSHISDSAFYQVMELSVAPVIASHSSCRYYTPDFERNMSDDMIRKLAENRGVIMINFGSYFLNNDFRQKMQIAYNYIDEHKIEWGSNEQWEYLKQYKIDNHVPQVTLDEVVDHINHVVAYFGVDYVGLGSDFDGVNDLPEGLSDASMFPNLIERLLEDGYSEEDVRKICSENLFRVWNEVDSISENWENLALNK